MPNKEQFIEWRSDYESMHKSMFFGEVPSFDEIITFVGDFQDKLNRRGVPAHG